MLTALQKSKNKVDTDLERAQTENRKKQDSVEQIKKELKDQENEYVSALVHHQDKFSVLDKQVIF